VEITQLRKIKAKHAISGTFDLDSLPFELRTPVYEAGLQSAEMKQTVSHMIMNGLRFQIFKTKQTSGNITD
jgi:hypothetical protein